MKILTKKILIALLIFLLTSFTIYSVLLISSFISWANENNLNPYINDENIINIDNEKIKEIGKDVKQMELVMNESLYDSNNYQDVLANYFEPLGYSVWSYMHMEIQKIFNTSFIAISILIGIGISIAYITITSKKISTLFKIIIGYFGVIIIVPHIYMYCYTFRLWDFITPYKTIPIYFYIVYTLVFVALYITNYIIGFNVTKKLNNAINSK